MMKKPLLILFTTILCGMLLIATLVITVDPFFHYHKPINQKYGHLYNEVYQDPGIALHFNYDTVMLGSSMTENFHPSNFKKYDEDAIKLSYSGATTKDLRSLLTLIYHSGNDIQHIYIDLNDYQLCSSPDSIFVEMPRYLYDESLLTDVQYIFNKDVIYESLIQLWDDEPLDFDKAFTWEDEELFGPQMVYEDFLSSHVNQAWIADNTISNNEALTNVSGNMENLLDIVSEHPETQFTFFFPPYSVAYWYGIKNQNEIDEKITMLMMAMEELLEYENIDIYFFMDDYETISDLSNYRDICHFKPQINDMLYEHMKVGKFEITADNYISRLELLKEFANNTDLSTELEEYINE